MSRIYNHLKSLEAQIRQEKIERGQAGLRMEHNAPPEQGNIAREQQVFQRAINDPATGIASGTIKTASKGYFVAALLVIGAGMSAVVGLRFYDHKITPQLPVAPVVVEQAAPVVAPIPNTSAPMVTATTESAAARQSGAEIPQAGGSKSAAATYEKARQPVTKMAALAKVMTDTEADAGVDGPAWESRSSALRKQLQAEAYTEASKSAQALARDFPERWEPWFWLGTAQLAQSQMDAAESALEHAARLDPKGVGIMVQRAILAQERGDHAAAVRLLGEARDLSPKSPQIYLNLGYSNDALRLPAEAEKYYRQFLSLTEEDGAYSAQRKHVLKRLGGKH